MVTHVGDTRPPQERDLFLVRRWSQELLCGEGTTVRGNCRSPPKVPTHVVGGGAECSPKRVWGCGRVTFHGGRSRHWSYTTQYRTTDARLSRRAPTRVVGTSHLSIRAGRIDGTPVPPVHSGPALPHPFVLPRGSKDRQPRPGSPCGDPSVPDSTTQGTPTVLVHHPHLVPLSLGFSSTVGKVPVVYPDGIK